MLKDPRNIVVLALLGIVAAMAFKSCYDGKKSEERITELVNRLAKATETVEVADGVYERLSVKVDDLSSAIEKLSDENAKLSAYVDAANLQVGALANISLKLKDERTHGTGMQSSQPATQPVEPTTQAAVSPTRDKVEFTAHLTYFDVSGYTVTNPPEFDVGTTWTKKIRVSAAVAKKPNGEWTTVVSANDPSVVDLTIDTSAIDSKLSIGGKRWYQHFAAVGHAAVNPSSGRADVGASILFRVGAFGFGPSVSLDELGGTYGVALAWIP
jgi:type II secretory pathway pseudopilin PulG